jgi:hypothetical protein
MVMSHCQWNCASSFPPLLRVSTPDLYEESTDGCSDDEYIEIDRYRPQPEDKTSVMTGFCYISKLFDRGSHLLGFIHGHEPILMLALTRSSHWPCSGKAASGSKKTPVRTEPSNEIGRDHGAVR